jgi:hypothetical protein
MLVSDQRTIKASQNSYGKNQSQAQCPDHLTELQWANERGLSRIWDCGKVRWEYEVV